MGNQVEERTDTYIMEQTTNGWVTGTADSAIAEETAAYIDMHGTAGIAVHSPAAVVCPTLPDRRLGYRFIKRTFDILASLIGLIVLSPLFLIISAVIFFSEDGRPVFHRRRCVGKSGFYDMLKFRTMVMDADNLSKYLTPDQIVEYRTNIKLKDDPRITKIGRFLRKTSLDELPQLLNIFRGEMSFVGPRPVVQEELEQYGRDSELLLSAKPGITGYWQIHGRSDSTYESGKRQQLELYYVNHRSFRLDAAILLCTIPAVLSSRGGY